jgi:hypothetical protein
MTFLNFLPSIASPLVNWFAGNKTKCGKTKTANSAKFINNYRYLLIMLNPAYETILAGICQPAMALYVIPPPPWGPAAAAGAFFLPFPSQLTIFAR